MGKNRDIDEEKKLIESIKYNKSNFDIIYKKYYKVVVNYLRSRINNKSIYEDLASEVFERAFKAIDDFKWQGVNLSAWIFRITRNLLTDYYRKINNRGADISITEFEDKIEDSSDNQYLDYIKDKEDKALYNSIREFGEEEQYLIYYKFFEDLKNTEIAKITGLTETNVGTKLYRIRKKLKNILQKKKIFL